MFFFLFVHIWCASSSFLFSRIALYQGVMILFISWFFRL